MSKERFLKRIALAEETLAPFGVGSYTKGITLIIGEQDSDPLNSPEQKPFCCTKGCSGWLNRLFDIEDVDESKLFWVNALNNDVSSINLGVLVNDLSPKKVIALGKVAQKECTIQGVNHIQCYHPQYWKRFRNKQRYPLLDMLEKI